MYYSSWTPLSLQLPLRGDLSELQVGQAPRVHAAAAGRSLVAAVWSSRLFDCTLGFPGEGPSGLPCSINIATLNVTAWSCWHEAREKEEEWAQLWLLQEHKMLKASKRREVAKSLRKTGWSSVFSGALRTDKDGASGGVAIIVRDHWDISRP